MDQATKEFWEQYKSAPGVLAVMPARIIGKSTSVHPGEPVSVTLEATLPDGRGIGMQLILSDPEAAAKIPETIAITTDEATGVQTRTHLDPTDVYLVLMEKPKVATVQHEEPEEPEVVHIDTAVDPSLLASQSPSDGGAANTNEASTPAQSSTPESGTDQTGSADPSSSSTTETSSGSEEAAATTSTT